MSAVSPDRLRTMNQQPTRGARAHVLYWMTAHRRGRANLALDHAVARARELDRPLLVLEALRAGHQHASVRFHDFVLAGMADNAAEFEAAGITYYPYVEPTPGAGRGLLMALADHACEVITDDWPSFFVPRMLDAAAEQLDVKLVAVDGNGIVPMRAATRTFPTAAGFRRHVHRHLLEYGISLPRLARHDSPGMAAIPDSVRTRWPPASSELLTRDPAALAELPIDHGVPPVSLPGGHRAARRRLEQFVHRGLADYGTRRNRSVDDASSGLSPYLHWGHLGSHAIVHAVLRAEDWDPGRLDPARVGNREGFWGVSAGAESFLDQIVTWREIGFNRAHREPDGTSYDALPHWARASLEAHESDPRPALYSLEDLECARTDDPVWNAAQRQLRREGIIHNYLRMLWGKRILEWTPTARHAMEVMVHLNDRWALDGRDPNSYTGIQWVLGRYDRAWGPERPIFGKIRYMTSASTRRKLDLTAYLERGDAPGAEPPAAP